MPKTDDPTQPPTGAPAPPPLDPKLLASMICEALDTVDLGGEMISPDLGAKGSLYRVAAEKVVVDMLRTAAARASPWQPMDTAPKDGRDILGFQRDWCINGGEVNITSWSADWEAWQIPHFDWRPTHWMPLPMPPASPPEPDK